MAFKQILISLICIGLLQLFSLHAEASANQKAEQLRQKMADITLVHQQLKDRIDQAEALREALWEQQNALTAEIKVLTKSLNIQNYKQAHQHLRIRYNMELIGTIMSYLSEFDTKIRFYQTGRDKLSYLHQLAEDDIKMVTTMNDLKIDALATQISLVINRYLPQAHIIQIDPDGIDPASAEDAWKEVVQRK